MRDDMRDDGLPTEPDFYWTLRVGTKYVPHGTPQVVQLKRTGDGDLWGDGFGDMELSEIGFAWEKVKPFDAFDRDTIPPEVFNKAELIPAPQGSVIDKMVLAALDDMSKVLIVASEHDLDILIHATANGGLTGTMELRNGLIDLRRAAFGESDDKGKR